MHLSTPPSKLKPQSSEEIGARLWTTLSRVQSTLGVTDPEYAELLRVTHKQLLKFRSNKTHIPMDSFFALTEELRLSPEKLFSGDIDFYALSMEWEGEAPFLPERYSENAKSSVRAVTPLLNYIEESYGWEKVSEALRHLQVSPSLFKKPNLKTSILFTIDMYKYLSSNRLPKADFMDIGKQTVIDNLSSEIGTLLSKEKTCESLLARYINEIIPRFFEKNANYSLTRLSSEGCQIRYLPSEECLELFEEDPSASALLCYGKTAMAGAIPYFIGKSDAVVEKTACFFRGDSHCLLNLSFPHPDSTRQQLFS